MAVIKTKNDAKKLATDVFKGKCDLNYHYEEGGVYGVVNVWKREDWNDVFGEIRSGNTITPYPFDDINELTDFLYKNRKYINKEAKRRNICV